MIYRDELLKKLFPLGIPKTREDWNYAINARAVYEAIIKCDHDDSGLANLRKIKETGFAPKK